jgi:hypothetical protein
MTVIKTWETTAEFNGTMEAFTDVGCLWKRYLSELGQNTERRT